MTNIDSASVTRRREGAPPQPPSPKGALALLSGNQRRAAQAALRLLPPYIKAVEFIRQHGSCTRATLRLHFGWSKSAAHIAVVQAIRNGLIAKIGKQRGCHGQSIYAPVVVPGWPR